MKPSKSNDNSMRFELRTHNNLIYKTTVLFTEDKFNLFPSIIPVSIIILYIVLSKYAMKFKSKALITSSYHG